MANIRPEELSKVLAQELGVYTDGVLDRLDKLTKDSAEKLVNLTRSTAPVGARKKYAKKIACQRTEKSKTRGVAYTWYVKSPEHRLTHLLVNGHATRDGGRTKPNPFLENALNEVLPDFEREIEEVFQ